MLNSDPIPFWALATPPLAHRGLTQDAVAGLLLACNVTVESENEDTSSVRIANPEVVLSVGSLEQDTELANVAQEARKRLERVAEPLLSS